MRYRRNFIAGGSYFFTVVTYRRRPIFERAEAVELLRKAFRNVMQKHPFTIDAIVILPDHLHTIWTLPTDDSNYPLHWRLVKTWFTQHRDRLTSNHVPMLWQQRYWEHTLRDQLDFERHADYIHFNPVRHGYVSTPNEWPWSSFRQFVQRGIYPQDWGIDPPDLGTIGEE